MGPFWGILRYPAVYPPKLVVNRYFKSIEWIYLGLYWYTVYTIMTHLAIDGS